MMKKLEGNYKLIVIVVFLLCFFSCKKKTHFIETHYYDTGELFSEIPYNIKDSLKDGVFKEYYKNGNLKKLIHFKNDKPVDSSKIFFESGELEFREIKKRDTIYTYHYYKEGNISLLGKYTNTDPPLKIGWHKIFNKSGILTDSIEYFIVNNKYQMNQLKHYNRNKELVIDSSYFYNFNLSKVGNTNMHQLKINYEPQIKNAQVYFIFGDSIHADFDNLNKVELDTIYMKNNEIIAINPFDGKYKHLKGFFYEYIAFVKDTLENDSIKMTIQDKRTYFNQKIYVTDTIDEP